jgi:hypothetical protein
MYCQKFYNIISKFFFIQGSTSSLNLARVFYLGLLINHNFISNSYRIPSTWKDQFKKKYSFHVLNGLLMPKEQVIHRQSLFLAFLLVVKFLTQNYINMTNIIKLQSYLVIYALTGINVFLEEWVREMLCLSLMAQPLIIY